MLRTLSLPHGGDLESEWQISDGCLSLTGGKQDHFELIGLKLCHVRLYAVTRGRHCDATASVLEIHPYSLYQATVQLISVVRSHDGPSAVSLSTVMQWYISLHKSRKNDFSDAPKGEGTRRSHSRVENFSSPRFQGDSSSPMCSWL